MGGKPSTTSARYAVIKTLMTVARNRLPASQVLDQSMRQYQVLGADRQLAKKICYGVLRQKEYLDSLLSQLCRQPLKKIKPFAYHALLTGLYQLFFLDRIPESAAVNETVKAVTAARLPKSIQGFVNGVLRQSIRRRTELLAMTDSSSLNHPEWMKKRWRRHFGEEEMTRICTINNLEPALCLRTTHKTSPDRLIELFKHHGIAAHRGVYAPDSVILDSYQGPITDLPGFATYLFQVQGQAAQLATLLLSPFKSKARYLDCCAGAGGKTAHLLCLIQSSLGTITALEPHTKRFELLKEIINKTGQHEQVYLFEQTLEEFATSAGHQFDAILIDAPCSGTGVIRKHPDIRWNREENQLLSYQNGQLALLRVAASLLVPGGVIVYATCSIEPEENQQVISTFLQSQQSLKLTDCRNFLPATTHQFVQDKFFMPLPKTELEGFFAARLTSTSKSD